MVPAFHRGELTGFAVTTAHHLDIGAHTPGSGGIVDAIDCYAEGLRFQAIKVYEAGKRNQQVWNMLRTNIRLPDLVLGDMDAQIAAARIGAQRYVELIELHGLPTIVAASEDMFDSSERKMRSAIRALPDGDYSATAMLDGYLDDPNPARKDLPIKVTIRKRGDEHDGRSQRNGAAGLRPADQHAARGYGRLCHLALHSLRASRHGGARLDSAEQRLGAADRDRRAAGHAGESDFPGAGDRPLLHRHRAFQCGGAGSRRMSCRSQVCGGCGNGGGLILTGQQGNNFWVQVELFSGSYGGRYGSDGMDSVDVLYANTRNNPIEDIESHVPLRIDRYELRENAAAPGRWRGGVGSIRQVTFLADGAISVESEGHKYPPKGLFGGSDGTPSQLVWTKADGEVVQLPSKLPYHPFAKGDRITAIRACGGAYGNPLERDPADVLDDVLDEYITRDKALADYGVVITDRFEVDAQATGRERQARAARRSN